MNIDPDILKKQIAGKRLAKAYLIFGKDVFLVQTCVSMITAAVLPKENGEMLTRKFDCPVSGSPAVFDELLRTILNACEDTSLFGDRGIVIVRDLPFDKLSKKGLALFKERMQDLPDCNILLFVYRTTEIKMSRGVPSESRWATVFSYFDKDSCVLDCGELSDNRLIATLRSGAAKLGCSIDDAAAKYMTNVCGRDLALLQQEKDKLCAVAGAGDGKITRAMIDMYASKTTEATVYDLSDAIAAGRTNRAFEILDLLERQKVEPPLILGTLAGSFLDIYRMKVAAGARRGTAEFAEAYGYGRRAFILDRQDMKERAAAADMKAVRGCLELLADADADIKGGSRTPPMLILRRLVTEMTAAEKIR